MFRAEKACASPTLCVMCLVTKQPAAICQLVRDLLCSMPWGSASELCGCMPVAMWCLCMYIVPVPSSISPSQVAYLHSAGKLEVMSCLHLAPYNILTTFPPAAPHAI